MNKALIWVGVLAVVCVVVFFLARGGGGEDAAEQVQVGTKGLVPEKMPPKRGNVQYTNVVASLAQAATPTDRSYIMSDYDRWDIWGAGVVVEAGEAEGGGWYVDFDMDPEKSDGADLSVLVSADEVAGRPVPTVGEQYRFHGMMILTDSGGEGDSLFLALDKGQVSK